MKNKQIQKKIKKSFFVVYAVLLIFAAFGVTTAAADTSVAWTKDIGDVTAADMSEDGSVIYAAVGSQVFVYDAAGVQQNTLTVGGTVVKLVCTADGTRAALYTDGNDVYYIDNGVLTWSQSFTAITDIDISNAGNVLIVEGTQFHKFLIDGSLEYDSNTGTYNLGVIDPNDEFAIVGSSGNVLQKYILTTTDQYWAKVGDNSFNTNFSDYQKKIVFNPNSQTIIKLNKSSEVWDSIYTSQDLNSRYYAVSNDSLIQTDAFNYNLYLQGKDWTQATAAAPWGARSAAVGWVFNDKMWIGSGEAGGYSRYHDVWYSENGVDWTQATAAAPWRVRSGAVGWVFNDKMWIAGGYTSNGYCYDVWYSENGVDWTQATAAAWTTYMYYSPVWVYDNQIWLVSGQTNPPTIWHSSNGIEWESISSNFPGVSAAWVYNNKMWGASSSGNIYTSTNGVDWTQIATAAWGSTAMIMPSTWVLDNKMWIGAGTIGNREVWYSENGVDWTQATTGAWGTLSKYGAIAWTYQDKLWIGGGYYNGNTRYRDVWYSDIDSLTLQIQSNESTSLFYNYTGTDPQHTQTTYENAVPFTGTTELRTKPTLSIYDLQTTKTLNGNIAAISLSDRGDWLGTATTTRIYHDQVTDSGFGTEYYAALGSEGLVYDIATANSASMSVVGQGQVTDIYSMSASRVGTYTAGSSIEHVDIADKNALWATSGGEDGKVYVFSKDESSNWYLEYSSDSENPIQALRMSARGEYILAGRSNSLTLYQTNTPAVTTTDFWFTLYAYKDSESYRNAAVNVSVYTGNQWNFVTQGVMDSAGKYVIQLTAGNNYKFDIGNGEKILIYMASPSVTSQTVSIYSSPISTSVEYNAVWDSSTNSINFNYTDHSSQTEAITVKVLRTDTWESVYENTFSDRQTIEESLPIIDDTTSYKVEFSVRRVSGVSRNTFIVSSSRDIIPIPLDQNIKNILFCGLLFVVAGLFSYLSAYRGPIVVSLVAGLFIYLGWVTIPWEWFIITIGISIVAGLSQRRD